MELEAEFRLYLERQKLERAFCTPCEVFPSQENFTPSQANLTPSTWVKLREFPSAFSADEALLLCQCSETQWLAWVPDYGEILLRIDQFSQDW